MQDRNLKPRNLITVIYRYIWNLFLSVIDVKQIVSFSLNILFNPIFGAHF